MSAADLVWNVSCVEVAQPDGSPPGSGEPLIYTKEFCWNVTDWLGSLEEEVATADSRTTWILEPSLFCLTFSVTFTLRRLSVEKPEEHSVSVGELGQERVARPAASSMEVTGPPHISERESTSCNRGVRAARSVLLCNNYQACRAVLAGREGGREGGESDSQSVFLSLCQAVTPGTRQTCLRNCRQTSSAFLLCFTHLSIHNILFSLLTSDFKVVFEIFITTADVRYV